MTRSGSARTKAETSTGADNSNVRVAPSPLSSRFAEAATGSLGGAAWTAGGAAAPTAGAASSARSANEGARPATRAKAASPAANLPAILKAIPSSIAVRGPKAYKAKLVRGSAKPAAPRPVIGRTGLTAYIHPLKLFWPLLRPGHGRLKTCQTGDEPDMKAQSLPGSEIRRPQRAVAFAGL